MNLFSNSLMISLIDVMVRVWDRLVLVFLFRYSSDCIFRNIWCIGLN